jgi:hypothetical protein
MQFFTKKRKTYIFNPSLEACSLVDMQLSYHSKEIIIFSKYLFVYIQVRYFIKHSTSYPIRTPFYFMSIENSSL